MLGTKCKKVWHITFSPVSNLEDVVDCHEQYSHINNIRIFRVAEQDKKKYGRCCKSCQ